MYRCSDGGSITVRLFFGRGQPDGRDQAPAAQDEESKLKKLRTKQLIPQNRQYSLFWCGIELRQHGPVNAGRTSADHGWFYQETGIGGWKWLFRGWLRKCTKPEWLPEIFLIYGNSWMEQFKIFRISYPFKHGAINSMKRVHQKDSHGFTGKYLCGPAVHWSGIHLVYIYNRIFLKRPA